MKNLRHIIALNLVLLSVGLLAQTDTIYVEGQVLSLPSGTPSPDHPVYLWAYPDTANPATYMSDTVYTDTNGNYSFSMNTIWTPGISFPFSVSTYDCQTNLHQQFFWYSGNSPLYTANFSVCDTFPPPFSCENQQLSTYLGNYTMALHGEMLSPQTASYFWSFGDGNTAVGADVIHHYPGPGVFYTTLTTYTTDSCMNVTYAYYGFTDPPGGCESSFTTTPGYDLYSLYFHPTTTSQYPTDFTWSFGDGTSGSGQPIYHTYGSFGTYPVTLTAVDTVGCTFIYTASVTVSDTINPTGCDNYIDVLENVEHTVSLSGGLYSGQAISYFWDLGDGNTSTDQAFSHTYEYPGYHTISLETYTNDSCYDQTERTILLTDSVYTGGCDCGFITTPGNDPLTKIFQAQTTSIYPTQYTWSFADGTHGSGPSVSHTFGNNGNYNVQVRCQDSAGCICISSIPIMVGDSVDPTNCENWINILGITGHTINLYPVIVYGEPSYRLWDLGDGTTSTALEVIHTYAAAGLYTVTLQTQTWDGCSDQSSIIINITDSIPNDCSSYFSASAANNLYEIHFAGYTSSQYPASYLWNFGDPASGTNNTSTIQNPNHTFSAAGTYSVMLIIVDSTNCTSTFSAPVILSLYSNYSLFGQVFAGNQSITACKVQLFSQDYTGSMNLIGEAIPDSANYYKFDTVSSGIYHILAIPEQGTIYALQYLPTYFGDAFLWENSTPVVLGQPTNPYHIHLANFDSISGGDGIITGGLTTGGKSIDVGNQEILILDNANIPVKYMFSKTDGTFSFSGLPYGEYKVYPVITGIRTYPVTVILSETNKSATVIMKISGQSVAGKSETELSNRIENMYPNPVSDLVSITVKGKGKIKIQIADVSGKIVLTRNENIREQGELISLSVDELLKGLYLMIIQDEKGNTSSRRFIKN